MRLTLKCKYFLISIKYVFRKKRYLYYNTVVHETGTFERSEVLFSLLSNTKVPSAVGNVIKLTKYAKGTGVCWEYYQAYSCYYIRQNCMTKRQIRDLPEKRLT